MLDFLSHQHPKEKNLLRKDKVIEITIVEDMLTTCPFFLEASNGNIVEVTLTVPTTLTFTNLSQSCEKFSTKTSRISCLCTSVAPLLMRHGVLWIIPALFTRQYIGPRSDSTSLEAYNFDINLMNLKHLH